MLIRVGDVPVKEDRLKEKHFRKRMRKNIGGEVYMEKIVLRQKLDYDIVPGLFHYEPSMFAMQLSARAEDFFAGLFNDVYSRGLIDSKGSVRYHWRAKQPFTSKDFNKTPVRFSDEVYLIYVELPSADDEKCDYCIAYALLLTNSEYKFYTIEKNVSGKIYIGTVDKYIKHTILCEVDKSSLEDGISLYMQLYSLYCNGF